MRARNIKPGFFENEQLADLPFEARLLFIGLWCYADREGRFEWRPKRIKALLFPYDPITANDIECHLMSLHVMTLILQYKSGDSLYGVIPNFVKHQNPHPHEARSILPDPQTDGAIIQREPLATMPKPESVQCHDMSVECNADSLIPDSLILKEGVPNGTLSGNPENGSKTAIPYREIVEHLNRKSGKNFKFRTKETQRHIKARWNAGFRLDDFKRVIDLKCEKWLTDPKMVDFVRPETLFGTKFESYLNETGARRQLTWAEKRELEQREHARITEIN